MVITSCQPTQGKRTEVGIEKKAEEAVRKDRKQFGLGKNLHFPHVLLRTDIIEALTVFSLT